MTEAPVVWSLTAGGSRLWSSGRAVRRSGWSCWSWRHDWMLQKLHAGTDPAAHTHHSLWYSLLLCSFSSFVVNFSFGSFWASLVQFWIQNVVKTIQRLRDTGVEHFWLFAAGLCPAAGWRRRQPAGERSSDLRGNHRPGDLGGCALPGRVGSGSPAGFHWKVTKPQNYHENFTYSDTNNYCLCWLFSQLIDQLFGLLNVRKCRSLFLRANNDALKCLKCPQPKHIQFPADIREFWLFFVKNHSN